MSRHLRELVHAWYCHGTLYVMRQERRCSTPCLRAMLAGGGANVHPAAGDPRQEMLPLTGSERPRRERAPRERAPREGHHVHPANVGHPKSPETSRVCFSRLVYVQVVPNTGAERRARDRALRQESMPLIDLMPMQKNVQGQHARDMARPQRQGAYFPE